MQIQLRTFANIKDILGTGEIVIELPRGARLSDLFAILKQRFGLAFDRQVRDQETGEIVPFLILINEKTFRSSVDMGVVLRDRDTVTIMIPFDGG